MESGDGDGDGVGDGLSRSTGFRGNAPLITTNGENGSAWLRPRLTPELPAKGAELC